MRNATRRVNGEYLANVRTTHAIDFVRAVEAVRNNYVKIEERYEKRQKLRRNQVDRHIGSYIQYGGIREDREQVSPKDLAMSFWIAEELVRLGYWPEEQLKFVQDELTELMVP